MPKATLSDLSNLQNEQSAISTINANNTVIEDALENTLSRNGQTPNQMEADLDMNSNNIINVPHTLEDGNAISYGQVLDLIDSLSNGAVIDASFVVLEAHDQITDERVLTAGPNIGILDGGPGSTVTVSISGEDLTAYEALGTTGLVARLGEGSVTTRTLTAPAEGITVTDGDGVAGNPTLVLANDLAALEGLSSTGMIARTATDTAAVRTITGTANEITLTNGDGVSGNPTVSIPTAVTFTGKTVTGGTFTSPTINTPTLTINDNAFTLQDQTDTTKKVQFEASGISTGTTRTLTLPDGNTSLIGASVAATLTNKTIALGSNTVSGTTAQFNTALTDNDFATLAGSETLTNKTITSPTITVRDNVFTLQDNTDATKQAQFELSGITTGNTRTFTFPDSTTTLVGQSNTQSLTNKTINLSSNTLTGTTAQFNTALSDNDFATLAGSETLTNKTISGSSNTITNIGGTSIRMGSDAQGDVLYFNGTDYVRLGAGTSGNFLKTQGAGANPTWAAVPGGGDLLAANNLSDLSNTATGRSNIGAFKRTVATPVATTSGSTASFTGLPSGITQFRVIFNGVSTNGTNPVLIQIGDSGGFATTGYVSENALPLIGGSNFGNTSTSGFYPTAVAASSVIVGFADFTLLSAATNTWIMTSLITSDSANIVMGVGTKTLSGTLTQIRLSTADTFDAGSVGLHYDSP